MNYSPEKSQLLEEGLLPKTSGEIDNSSITIIRVLQTKVAAPIITLIFASCAAHQKSVSEMTLEEFIKKHPDCVRVIETEDATVTDYSRCEDIYDAKIQKPMSGGSFRPGVRPENWEEGLKHMEQNKPIIAEKDINWWKINMEMREGESRVDYATRVENLARDFMKDKLAECNYAASGCHGPKDYDCLLSIQQTAIALGVVANTFINQAIKAWEDAMDAIRAQTVKEELGCELLRLAKFASNLVRVTGGPIPEIEKLSPELTAKCQ